MPQDYTHPITPPLELVDQWVIEACPECLLTYDEFTGESVQILVTRAAQWGADQELEACREWLRYEDRGGCGLTADWLYEARRPKPVSLKVEALRGLEGLAARLEEAGLPADLTVLYRALEQLPDPTSETH